MICKCKSAIEEKLVYVFLCNLARECKTFRYDRKITISDLLRIFEGILTYHFLENAKINYLRVITI